MRTSVRPRPRRAALLAALIAAAVLALPACGRKKSVRHGKDASTWIAELGKDDEKSVASARLSLEKMGHDATDPLAVALADPKTAVRMNAAAVLGALGHQAKDAVDALVAAMKDPEATVRAAAANALGRVGPGARKAVPALVSSLADTDAAVRSESIRALALLGAPADQVVPALRKALDDPEEKVQDSAAFALAALGSDAVEAREALAGALKKGATLRWPAVLALMDLEPGGGAALEPIAGLLGDPEPGVRREAAKVLGILGKRAATRLPALVALLSDADASVRAQAVWSLGQIGPSEKTHTDALLAALKDPDTDVRLRAAEALALLGIHEETALAALVETLQDSLDDLLVAKNRNTVVWASDKFAALGAKAAPAVPVLVAALENEDLEEEPDVLVRVMKAVESIGPKAAPAIPAITDLLIFDYEDVSIAGAKLLGTFGHAARSAVPELRKTAKDKLFQRLRAASATALGLCAAPGDKDTIKILESLVDPKVEKHAEVRKAAEEALARLRK